MRPAVLAVAVAFDPRLALIRGPLRGLARRAAALVMKALDARRARLDA